MPNTEISVLHGPAAPKKRQNGQKRTARPAPLIRRITPSKFAHKAAHPPSGIKSDAPEGEASAVSFQEFCTTCEKQLSVSCPSVLYCSERCRERDSDTQALPLFKTDISPSPTPPEISPSHHLPSRDIIPQLSPTTKLLHASSIHLHQYGDERRVSQPSITSYEATNTVSDPSTYRSESEAAQCLVQLGSRASYRHEHSRNSSEATDELAPSLSITPVSSASSTMPFTLRNSFTFPRHPSRTNPRWSSISFSSRSVDLITPIAHVSSLLTTADASPAQRDDTPNQAGQESIGPPLSEETEQLISSTRMSSLITPATSSKGGSKQLFGFDEMRSEPRPPQAKRNLFVTSPLSPLSTNSAGNKT